MKALAPGFLLLASATMVGATAAQAQDTQPPAIDNPAAAYPEDASSALARHIRVLATSPRDVEALLGAGNAACEVGDVEAALAFFVRADDAAPRDGRVKAGMGSALVQAEQPQEALKFFAEAIKLDIPAWRIANDRGLAYDMVGDQARAQADYALLLRRGSDAEVERRMALSKAISGDRASALAVLEPHLRRQDRASWRTYAFVLALTGDTKGAVKAIEVVMPGSKADEMKPFLERLPQLAAADRAMAVHFGRFPGEVQAIPAYYAPAPVMPKPPVAPPVMPKPRAASPAASLADIAALVKALPSGDEDGPDVEITEIKEQASPKPAVTKAAAKPDKKPDKKKAKPEPPKEPSRIWVQLASGQNRKAFAREFKEYKSKAPKLLAGKIVWIAKDGATNRLLVGPFKTDKEARKLVNSLAKEKISTFSWTSETGQKVEKMPSR
jgi:Flp pilus assembly protein TadD